MVRVLNVTGGYFNADETVVPIVAYDQSAGETVAQVSDTNTDDIAALDTELNDKAPKNAPIFAAPIGITGLGVYADNTDAIAGGQGPNTLYRNASGLIGIVF